jgi:peptidoglycan hydrolase-like protein with peptidoglycan-binding domain
MLSASDYREKAHLPWAIVPALALLGLVVALAGCGGGSETVTVTTTTSQSSESQSPPMGPAVVELQQVMTALGYYDGPIDGVYGEETVAGVKAMQEDLGLTADGIYGAETHAALKDKAASITVQIQTVLADYGYYDGEIDGTYGEETKAAVEELQKDLGVTVDGKVGPETVKAFNEAVASGDLTPKS